MKSAETIVGVDFAGPAREQDQRKKIVAIRAQVEGWNRYRVVLDDFNQRLLLDSPGWTLRELSEELVRHPAKIVGLDFPFSIPSDLLRDEQFAQAVGYEQGAFQGWRSFNWHVAWILRHRRATVVHAAYWPEDGRLDFSGFAPWRSKDHWIPRDTDRFANAHPPLKDRFQSLFQMTLAGNVLLDFLGTNGKYRIVPLWSREKYTSEAIEVYPGFVMRQLGLPNYKSQPEVALLRLFEHLRDRGIEMTVATEILQRCVSYSSSGNGRSPDHDVADALVALGTSILYRDGHCSPAVEGRRWENATYNEGVIWGLKAMSLPAGGKRIRRA
jgi:hypothetical protein